MDWFLYSWPTLILLGLGLRMALRLTYGVRGPEAGDPIFVFLSTTSWVLLGLGIAPAVIGGAITLVGGLLALLAATTLVEVIVQRRAAQRRSVSKMLALLVERGRQLDSSVLFAGHAIRGIAGRAAERLFAAIRSGTPLAEAIAAYPRALVPEAIAYLAAGRTKAAEAAALRELSRGEHNELATVWRACIDRLSYLVFVLIIMLAVLTFVMFKIVPEYEQIFAEFGVGMPRITALAISSSHIFTRYLGPPVGVALSLLILGGIAVGIGYLFDVQVLRAWSDWIFRGRAAAHVLRILALATEQRESLAHTLHWIAHVYPSALMRRRLTPVAAAVSAGADWRDALRNARVITRAEHALLKTAERAGNLPWALRQVAQRREKRAVYRLAAALQVVYPLVILLLGAVVGFYVLSLFVPIVELIHGLA